MSDLVGQNINQYRLDKVLGEGGMGRVYLAWDVNLDRQVAVKLMHSPLAVQNEFRQRLTQEAKTAASLEHPSIVRVYDFGDSEHGLFIAMEYIGGGTLRDLIRTVRQKNRFIQIDQVIQIGVHIAEALDYAHNFGVVHRDVKPGNVILKRLPQPEKPSGAPFRAMLSDFGLVKVSESTLKTQTGFTMGTPIYMSPEQCHGADLDGRSDIYSLGVVLYELVTGQPPFSFRSLTEALSTHMKAQMPSMPSSKRGEIPPVLDKVLMRMLAKDPADRYQHGQELAEVLRSASGALENNPTRAVAKISRPISDPATHEISTPPEGYALSLSSGDNEPTKIELNQAVITIGRSGNNDITLPLDGVSRFNTRLQATSAGWEITDLGGINGTFLNGERMPAQEGVLLKSGDLFEIESYRFTIEGPEEEEAEQESESPAPIISEELLDDEIDIDPVVDLEPEREEPEPEPEEEKPSSAGLKSEAEREKLTLMLPRDKYRIKAGQSATIALEVFNRSQEIARVNVRVMGLPSEWVKPPDEFIEIPARSSKSVPVRIHIPRNPDTPVGYQRMRVRLFSPQHPNLDSAASLMLELIGYSEFRAGMEPETIVLPDNVFVNIKNNGNIPGRYTVRLGPYDGKLQIGTQLQPILLPPGEGTTVTVPLEASRLRIFGNRLEDRFNIHVTDIDDEEQNRVMGGTVTFRPVLPIATAWMLGLLILAVMLFACITFTIRATNPVRDALTFFTGAPTPTQFTFLPPTTEIDQESIRLTSEAEAATQAAGSPNVVETATPVLELSDVDEDGASAAQEAVLGTNPNDPDSDKDGLRDGQEAFELGTNPLIQDTDKDGLLDGEEVINYNTNPLSADTDGDGFSDRDEVLAQTDPRTPATATPTVGPTLQPTEIPTETLTPVVAETEVVETETPVVIVVTATNTPIIVTATPTPTITATATLVPVETATETLIPTETAIAPTETLTPTAEVLPTATEATVIQPTLLLVCSSEFIPDGLIGSEWTNSLLGSNISQPTGTNTLEYLMHRDADNVYIGFRLSAPAVPAASKITILLDNGSGGDPDPGDLKINVSRDGTFILEGGVGSNADDLGFAQITDPTLLEQVVFKPNDPAAADWVAEIKIPTNLASALKLTQIKFAVNGQFGDQFVQFPAGADINLNDSLASVGYPACN